MGISDSAEDKKRQEKVLIELRKSLPFNSPDKDYVDYLEDAILKDPKHYRFYKKLLKNNPPTQSFKSMKKEIKEKIIKILKGQDNCYEMLGFFKGENKVADQILELFKEQRQKIIEEIIEEIDKVYKKEGGIRNWLDLREKLINQPKTIKL